MFTARQEALATGAEHHRKPCTATVEHRHRRKLPELFRPMFFQNLGFRIALGEATIPVRVRPLTWRFRGLTNSAPRVFAVVPWPPLLRARPLLWPFARQGLVRVRPVCLVSGHARTGILDLPRAILKPRF